MSISDIREPDGQEPAAESSAGDPRASGPEATREAMASAEAYRLSEQELDERDTGFTGPRKAQGPPLEEGEGPARSEAEAEQEAEETPPPEVPPAG